MIRWFRLQLLFVLSTSPSDLSPATNFHPQSNRSYWKCLQHPGEAIVPIEVWHNDVSNVQDIYEEEAEQGGNSIVGKEDLWYGEEEEEEEEALTNERVNGRREMLEGSHPLMQNGILGSLGLAKAAFQSLRGDTAEKLQLPEDRKRLVELVKTLLKPNLTSQTTPGLVERLLDEKTELNIGLRKDRLPNVENEIESQPEMEAEGVGRKVQQHQKPQPVLLLLKGWLVHV